MAEMTYTAAIIQGIAEEMRVDPKIFHMSTDAPGPLVKEFGDVRIKQTPITESALTGMAIGAAGAGYRPIVDWRLVTFCFVAMDQVVNQAAKIHYMFGGQTMFEDPLLSPRYLAEYHNEEDEDGWNRKNGVRKPGTKRHKLGS